MIKLIDILKEIDLQSKLSRGHKPDWYQLHSADFKPFDEDEDIEELNVRDEYGDRKVENPKTGKKIKFSSALKAPKGTAVYNKARKMYNRLKEK